MLRTLDAHHIQFVDVGGNKTNHYTVKLPPAFAYEDLFTPSFWKHHQIRLNLMDIVRVRAESGAFDVMLTVGGKAENGELMMELWPKFPSHMTAQKIADVSQAGSEARAVAPTKVPLSKADGMPLVRIEYLDATKWRLRGYDGQEVSRNHPTEASAKEAMARYLANMKLEMPDDEEISAAIAAAKEAKAKAVEKQTKKSAA